MPEPRGGRLRNCCPDAAIKELFNVLLKRGGGVRFQVRGWSMHPSIRDGEYLTVMPVDVEEARIGDVLARQNVYDKSIVVHRLIRKELTRESPFLIFCGDNTLSYDSPVYLSHYLFGKVVAIERHGRKIDAEGMSSRLQGYLRVSVLLCFWRLHGVRHPRTCVVVLRMLRRRLCTISSRTPHRLRCSNGSLQG